MTTVRTRRSRRSRHAIALSAVTTLALTLSACGSTSSAGSGDGNELTIVASTGVWGSIAKAVGGDSVEVKTIIDNNEADPHSYSSTPRDAATIGNADLVVYNGGGYDSFVRQILSSTTADTPTVRAVDFSDSHERNSDEHGSHEQHGSHEHGAHGHAHSGNEHVWYDLSTVHAVADRISDELGKLRPASSEEFHRAAGEFHARLGELQRQVDRIRAEHHGEHVLATAPVSDLLLEHAGLVNVTPPSFVQAVESGSDPAAATIAEMWDTVDSGKAAALIHNPQTSSTLTKRLRERAKRNGIPVVEMTETPPAGKTYVEWMGSQITALRKALDKP